MVISHKHRYLFLELPRTGSSAVCRELVDHYDGRRILKKHATYRDFLQQASEDEKKFFVFSSVRNPADKILSLYFKYCTDHRGYENPEIWERGNRFIKWLMQRQFRYVHDRGASFTEFFLHYYHLPYDDWSCLDHHRLDHVIYFENLSADFEAALRKLGLEPVRPLPVVNKTGGRKKEFWSYYEPEAQRRAQWVFGPYFRRWGYEFPAEWSHTTFRCDQAVFTGANFLRKAYWRFAR